MNTPRMPRLDVGHWLTILTVIVQAAIVVAVLNWRMGAVEKRLELMDERLWEHMTTTRVTAAPFCPPDVTRVQLVGLR